MPVSILLHLESYCMSSVSSLLSNNLHHPICGFLKRQFCHRFPPILVLHLKRFSEVRYRTKLSSKVDFPIENLDLSDLSSQSHCTFFFFYLRSIKLVVTRYAPCVVNVIILCTNLITQLK